MVSRFYVPGSDIGQPYLYDLTNQQGGPGVIPVPSQQLL